MNNVSKYKFVLKEKTYLLKSRNFNTSNLCYPFVLLMYAIKNIPKLFQTLWNWIWIVY